MFKKKFPKRIVNTIYFDTASHKDVWDNVNGFGNRKKTRVRWYNKLENSDVFFEEKKKINFITQKKIIKMGKFRDFKELSNFINSDKFFNSYYLSNYKNNFYKSIFIQYERNYFELSDKKIRLTMDNNLKVYNRYPDNFLRFDNTIIELKYGVENSNMLIKLFMIISYKIEIKIFQIHQFFY